MALQPGMCQKAEMTVIFIAIGGALGAVCRYLTVVGATRIFGAGFPWGTMIVNVLGSFVMGLAVALLMDRISGDMSRFAPLVMTGFLGGFTTFSAFSLDAYLLLERGRLGLMILYAGGSVLVSILALVLGIAIARTGSGI